MSRFIIRRLLGMIPFIMLVSFTVFVLIKLPPGDFVSNYAANLSASGETVNQATLIQMRQEFGLNQPFLVQYWHWIWGVVHGNFGYSFKWQQPVGSLIGDRLWLTMVLSFAAIIVTWVLALPIGIYSAVRQYSLGDYVFTFIGFIGLAVPSFLLALIVMYLGLRWFNLNLGGLFSPDYQLAPWSWGKLVRSAQASAGADADPGVARHRATDAHHAREPAG